MVSLVKGGNISLSKEAPGLSKVLLGLGWDARSTDGAAFDLDASAFLLGAGGKVRSDADFIFYNALVSTDGSVAHQGDNRTGAGEGDDEQIRVDLSKVSPSIEKIVVAVTIHDAAARRQNFGMVSNAFVRLIDDATGREVARYDLSEDASVETAMVFAELYRKDGDWKFRAVGQGFAGGLAALAAGMGVHIS